MPNGEGGGGTGGGGGFGPFELPPSLPEKPFDCDKPFIKDNPFLQQADRLYNDLFDYMKCKTAWGWMAFAIAGIGFVLYTVVGTVWGGLLGIITTVLASVASTVLDALGKARSEAAPDLNRLLGATMSELFGVEINTDELPAGGDLAGNRERARQIGRKLIDVLEAEFAPTGEISPNQGQGAAQAFTGFTTQFTVTSAFVAVLGEILSAGNLESFRELGVELAENLGLGRLQRRGLSELVGTTVATPYEWFLNKKYRPTMLSPGDAVRGFHAGFLDGPQLLEEFGRHGYDDTRRGVVQLLNTRMPTLDQLLLLELSGQMTHGDRLLWIRRMGYSEETADLVLRASERELERRLSFELAHRLLAQVLSGAIDATTYASVINRFMFTDAERRALVGMVSELLSHPSRRVTLAQMQSAFKQGVIAIDELEAFLVDRGYTEDDRQILVILTLLAEQKAEDAAKAKAARAAAKKPPTGGSTGTPTG